MTRRSAIIATLKVGIFLPPMYLLLMIQYGAITFPFWDHLETARQVVQYFDGTLTFHSLIEPQNQARPLFPRLIFVANAALTNWDIRSEFIYIYMTVYGSLLALLFALWKVLAGRSEIALLTAALLVSALACSPVGANNHVWSLMLIATLAHFGIVSALLIVSLAPKSASANVFAATLTWVATYSNSQGLFVFPIMILLHQATTPNKFALDRWCVFWIINLIACYILYLPGVPLSNGPRPAVFDFIAFLLVYIGNPLGSLLWFSATIAPPNNNFLNGICGALLICAGGITAWRSLTELHTRPEARVFITFAAFSGACAIVTAWGRAHGDDAISTAASSRYSIFAAFLLYGLVFYYAAKFARSEVKFARWHGAALAVLFVLTTVSYVRGIKVYTAYGSYDDWLAENYSTEIQPAETREQAYPNLDYFLARRADLIRLEIGPYRSVAHMQLPIYSGTFVTALPVTSASVISQRFRAMYPFVRSVSFQVATWGNKPTPYDVYWEALGRKGDAWAKLGEGAFSTTNLSDWKTVTVRMNNMTVAEEVMLSFRAKDSSVQNPVGIPLFFSNDAFLEPAEVNGVKREDRSQIGLTIKYDR
ncbi:hypothetical protein [Bradyrhizobium sp. AZCC 2230]|uniref:hypothetical protein n=1 Tax=Bradyrhizobium sp. AZCC 2230 TaxID=3117021 RepID=UPI002FF37D80